MIKHMKCSRHIISLLTIFILCAALVNAYLPAVVKVTPAQNPGYPSFSKQKGINVLASNLDTDTYGTIQARSTFKYLKDELSAEWVTMGPLGFQKEFNESELRQQWGYITSQTDKYKYRVKSVDVTDIQKTDELLANGIKDAHSIGLKVMLKPYADIDTFWQPTVVTKKPKSRKEELQEQRFGATSPYQTATSTRPLAKELRYYRAMSNYLATLRSLGVEPSPGFLDQQLKYTQKFKKFLEAEKPLEKKWENWFANYRDYILHYAKLAQDNKVEMFVIGDNLWPATQYEQQWRKLIHEIRTIYKGQITYAAGTQEYDKIKFWEALDYVGINAYFKVGAKTRREQFKSYVKGWQQVSNKLEQFYNEVRRPILFTEAGAPSILYAGYLGIQPLDPIKDALLQIHEDTRAQDNEAQGDYYESFFQVFMNKPWFAGVHWWVYYTKPYDHYRSAFDIEFSPYKRQAEGVLRKYFKLGYYYKTSANDLSNPPFITTPGGHEDAGEVYRYGGAEASKGTGGYDYKRYEVR